MVIGGLFLLPLVWMGVLSFWSTDDAFNVVPVWTLENYARFFEAPTYVRTFAKTLVMGAAVTAAGLIAAFPFAYFLVRYVSRRWQRLLLLAVIVPFWTSYLLRVYAWLAILGDKGVINQVLTGLGIIDEPSRLFVYNDAGVFIVCCTCTSRSRPRLTRRWRSSTGPSSRRPRTWARGRTRRSAGSCSADPPGVITACIFVFIPILGEFLTPTWWAASRDADREPHRELLRGRRSRRARRWRS